MNNDIFLHLLVIFLYIPFAYIAMKKGESKADPIFHSIINPKGLSCVELLSKQTSVDLRMFFKPYVSADQRIFRSSDDQFYLYIYLDKQPPVVHAITRERALAGSKHERV